MKRPYAASSLPVNPALPPPAASTLVLPQHSHSSPSQINHSPHHATTSRKSYTDKPWSSPLVKKFRNMRKTRSPNRPSSQFILWFYAAALVGGIGYLHFGYLRRQGDLREIDVSTTSSVDHHHHRHQQNYLQQRKLENAKPLAPSSVSLLEPKDYSQYTVRMNSWKRPEQIQIAIQHYQTCSGVAEIQITWCTAQGDPPEWLLKLQDATNGDSAAAVVVELHAINSLNERFHVLSEPPTRGILTVDDDVLRPCLALDAGFYKWTRHPDRMVGFDARTIDAMGSDRWKYGYLSTTKSTNQYSLTLTRFAFVHVDYLKSYMVSMPQSIRDKVHEHLNCEDIAMSLWVSSRTGGQVPLLADYWAMKLLVKLHSSGAISAMNGHKKVRDDCVEEFASALGLKDRLQPAQWVHDKDPLFECGAKGQGIPAAMQIPPRLEALLKRVSVWKTLSPKDASQQMKRLVVDMIGPALNAGLVQGTDQWKKRFNKAAG